VVCSGSELKERFVLTKLFGTNRPHASRKRGKRGAMKWKKDYVVWRQGGEFDQGWTPGLRRGFRNIREGVWGGGLPSKGSMQTRALSGEGV